MPAAERDHDTLAVPSRDGDAFDVQRARRETPGASEVLHFNNAGASLPPRCVVEAQVEHLELEARIGGYEARRQAADAYEETYHAVARLLACGKDEVALFESATAAWNTAFYAIRFQPGDRILTAQASYASNFIAFLNAAERYGVAIDVAPSDASGQVDVDALEACVTAKTRLIALTHVPTNGGLVNPAADVGAVARRHGVRYLLDACQSAGQMPLDVHELGCDLLSATGRKFLRGPRGTGFLYVNRERMASLAPPMPDLHSATWRRRDAFVLRDDAQRFEQWESNVAACIGLGVAVNYALGWGIDAIWERVQSLGAALRAGLQEVPGVTVHDAGKTQCGIVTFSMTGLPAGNAMHRLFEQGINVSVSTPDSTLLDAEARHLPEMVRASVHYFNTEEEVDRFAHAIHVMATGGATV